MKLSFNHSFYADGQGRDFRLTASPVTQGLLRKLDIRSRLTPSSMELYWGYEEREGERKGPLLLQDDTLVLTYLLEPTSPSFFNFTDLPFPVSAGDKYYYQALLKPEGAGTQHGLEGQEVKMFPLGTVLPYTPPEEATDLDLELINLSGISLGKDQILKEHAKKGLYPVSVTSDNDWGQYTLRASLPSKAGGEVVFEEPVHFLPDSLLVRCFGIMQFVIPADTIAALPKTEQAASLDLQFSIAFTRRETRWRYYFINQSKLDYDELQLLEDGTAISDVESAEKKLVNGSMATVLTLPKALPLEERTPKKMSLKILQNLSNGSPKKTVATVALPTPDSSRIYPERSGDDLVIYSDLYVYL